MSIKSWPKTERPREKLLKHGASILSDAELLAILLRVGTRGLSAVELGRELLGHYQTMGALFNTSVADFKSHKGLGEATYAQFAAVHEIAKRILSEELIHQSAQLTSSQSVKDYLRLAIGNSKIECFMALYLDAQNRLIVNEEVGHGSVSRNTVQIKEIIKKGLMHNASSIIVAHNHPAGSNSPSQEDMLLTEQLYSALKLVDITLLDHFLVTAQQSLSFKEEYWYSFE